MLIKDIDSFKKVCIENNYELLTPEKVKQALEDEGGSMPEDSINMLFENVIWYRKGDDRMYYQINEDAFSIQINRETLWGTPIVNDYNDLFEEVKRNCKYYKIITTESGNDYASYSCTESLYKGKIGFRIEGREGIVWTFPNE